MSNGNKYLPVFARTVVGWQLPSGFGAQLVDFFSIY